MGSGDLNAKKSWHVVNVKNQKKVWDSEQQALAARKRDNERAEELRKERQEEEIARQLEAAGGKKRVDRVDWMYQGPGSGDGSGSGSGMVTEEAEAFLLGKRRINAIVAGEDHKQLQKSTIDERFSSAAAGTPPPLLGATPTSARDMATKIREDPLLAIKRQEQQQYEALANDPVRRRQMMAAMGIKDKDKDKEGEEKRRSHRHRDEHRHRDDRDRHRHRHHDDRDRHRHRDDRDRDRHHRDHDRSRDRSDRGDRGDRKEHGRDDDERHRRRHHDRSPRRDSRERTRDRDGGRDGARSDGRRDGRRERSSRSASRSRSQSPRERKTRDDRDRRSDRYDRYDRHDRGHNDRRPNGISQTGGKNDEAAEAERARKLAAMQANASSLETERSKRLAEIEAQEAAARAADDAARSKAAGGTTAFSTNLHQKAGDMGLADRLGRSRRGLVRDDD